MVAFIIIGVWRPPNQNDDILQNLGVLSIFGDAATQLESQNVRVSRFVFKNYVVDWCLF